MPVGKDKRPEVRKTKKRYITITEKRERKTASKCIYL